MGELRIKIPDVLHKRLKQKALEENTTLKSIVIKLLEIGVSVNENEKR